MNHNPLNYSDSESPEKYMYKETTRNIHRHTHTREKCSHRAESPLTKGEETPEEGTTILQP